MRTYRELFGVAEFRAVFAAQFLTVASASVGSLALGTITYAATRNAIASGLAMCGGPLIRLIASWFLLSASDLLRPRTALCVTATASLAADLLQALPGLPWGARFAILALPWIVMSATGGAAMALVADILPSSAFLLGRATLNIVGGMQIVGCESLFIPLAGRHAGYLYAATAAGMLAGDIVVGRFVPEQVRDRWLEPLRILLAAPYLALLFHPPLGLVAALAGLASVGYAASLPLQERLVRLTSPDVRGQALGLNATGLLAFQGIGAVLAGTLAELTGAGPAAAGTAIGIAAALSLGVAVALIPGLRRATPRNVIRPWSSARSQRLRRPASAVAGQASSRYLAVSRASPGRVFPSDGGCMGRAGPGLRWPGRGAGRGKGWRSRGW